MMLFVKIQIGRFVYQNRQKYEIIYVA